MEKVYILIVYSEKSSPWIYGVYSSFENCIADLSNVRSYSDMVIRSFDVK